MPWKYVLLLVLLCCQSCSLFSGGSAPENELDRSLLRQDPELLIGTWRWLSDTYYFTVDGKPNRVTPSTAGYSLILRFDEDGTVATFKDGELEMREPYKVEKRIYSNGTSSDAMLFIGEHGGGAQFGVAGSKLLISTAFVDGPESIYERED